MQVRCRHRCPVATADAAGITPSDLALKRGCGFSCFDKTLGPCDEPALVRPSGYAAPLFVIMLGKILVLPAGTCLNLFTAHTLTRRRSKLCSRGKLPVRQSWFRVDAPINIKTFQFERTLLIWYKLGHRLRKDIPICCLSENDFPRERGQGHGNLMGT